MNPYWQCNTDCFLSVSSLEFYGFLTVIHSFAFNLVIYLINIDTTFIITFVDTSNTSSATLPPYHNTTPLIKMNPYPNYTSNPMTEKNLIKYIAIYQLLETTPPKDILQPPQLQHIADISPLFDEYHSSVCFRPEKTITRASFWFPPPSILLRVIVNDSWHTDPINGSSIQIISTNLTHLYQFL